MADETVQRKLEGASRVLVLGSGLGEGSIYRDLFETDEPDRVLSVTYTQSPGRWLRRHGLTDNPPADLAVIDVGGQQGGAEAFADGGLTDVETLSNPQDLTGLGIALNGQIDGWEPGERNVLCFDSITALLQYTDVETAYRFLHLLTTRLDRADGVGFFHFDPNAHDDRTRHTLLSLFDATVQMDPESGEYVVQSR